MLHYFNIFLLKLQNYFADTTFEGPISILALWKKQKEKHLKQSLTLKAGCSAFQCRL